MGVVWVLVWSGYNWWGIYLEVICYVFGDMIMICGLGVFFLLNDVVRVSFIVFFWVMWWCKMFIVYGIIVEVYMVLNIFLLLLGYNICKW